MSAIKSIKKRIYAWISKKYMDGCSNYNSLEVRKGCRSKEQARAMFEQHEVPHAKGLIFLSPFKAKRFAEEHGFPLVIKPNVSGFSRGSHFPINNYKELWRAAFMVKVWWPTSVVEQYLRGSNYRVLATRDQIVSVIRRYPPFVDGDGRHSISQLIEAENRERESMDLYPVIYPIKKSAAVAAFLKKQGLDFDNVPAAGERIELFNRVALAPGGIVETIEQVDLPTENIELFKRVVSMFDANVLGIDVIMEQGIDIPYTQQKCILLEVNSRPYMKMHNVPRYGKQEDLSAFYASMDELQIADADIF